MELTLPGFDYKVKKQNEIAYIYDVIRKKYVVLTPEEWVRQHVIHYLVGCKSYPAALIAVEKEINLYGLKRRFDLVCYGRNGHPYLLVECKAPTVALSQTVFDQVFGYNLTVGASYVAITNGIVHFCGSVDKSQGFRMLSEIPVYPACS